MSWMWALASVFSFSGPGDTPEPGIGPLDSYPEPPPAIERAAPEFPERAEQGGVLAACAVVYAVGADGAAEDACVACDVFIPAPPGITPPPALRNAVIAEFELATAVTVAEWRFTPGEPGLRYGSRIIFTFPTAPDQYIPATPEPDQCVGDPIS